MIRFIFTLILFCFFVPIYCTPPVLPWGIQNSIRKSPFNPPWYDLQNATGGIYGN